MQNIPTDPAPETPALLVPWDKFLGNYGRSRQSGARWRRELPWLDKSLINVLGRLYLPSEVARQFHELATAGKLALVLRVPPPPPRGPRKRNRKAKKL